MVENICKWCGHQGINLQNIQTAYTAQYQNKQPNQKWAEGLTIHFSKKTYVSPKGTWKDAQHSQLLKKWKSKL